jgi:hypothetical protein
MRVAPEQLGAPTIGGRSARPGGGSEGSHRSQISLLSCPECMKMEKKTASFPALIDLKKAIFHLKVLNKIYSQTFKIYYQDVF